MPFGRSLLVLACALGASAARAAEPERSNLGAHLIYEREPAAAICPDEPSLRAAVARRIGFDPFDEAAPRTIVCRVSRLPRGLRVRIEIGTDGTEPKATRELVSRRTDCDDLAEALTVAIAIAINPLVAPARPVREPPWGPVSAPPAPVVVPVAEPTALVADPPVAALAPKVPPVVPPRVTPPPLEALNVRSSAPAAAISPAAEHGLEWRFAVDGAFATGINPGLTYAGDVAIGLAGRRYSTEVGVRVAGPSSLAVGHGSIRVWQWAVLLTPCAHNRYLSACLLGSAGIVYGNGEGFAITQESQSPAIAAGGRAAAEYPLSEKRLRLRATLDVTAALTRTHFAVGGVEAWTSPRAAAALGLGLVGVFF